MTETPEKILVVDDEENVRKVLCRMLEDAGYEVITAANGNEALDKISEHNPELVLLDIKMPGKSGTEVFQGLRTSHPDTAVIMATAVSDVRDAINIMKEGAFDYLTKPFNMGELVISVARALERRRLILENRDYRLNLEAKVAEQTQLLEQKIRELTALNNLFITYLNQGFEAAETYSRLAHSIIEITGEIQALFEQGSNAAKAYSRLAGGIIEAAETIQTMAKETEARKVEVPDSPAEKEETSQTENGESSV